jgi:hypothetical protein
METPRLRVALGALRRFGVDRLRCRALTGWLPALERRLIASPRFGQGIVAGQANTLEGTSSALAGQPRFGPSFSPLISSFRSG